MKSFIYISQILLILLSSINVSFAQPSSSLIILDNIQINNQEAEITKDNKIFGKEGDAIRIAGKLLSGDKVIVFVGDKEYVATIDENMNWFVLFSITGFIEEEYAIQAQVVENNNLSDKVLLTTLLLSEKPKSNEDINISDEENSISNFGFKDILIIILSISFIYTLLNYLILKSKVEKSKKRK